MASAQTLEYKDFISNHILPAPQSVFEKFRSAGMNPVNHSLTASEKQKVEQVFSQLPALHVRILKEHLHSISFMDNMPNTALTSPVETDAGGKMYNIVIRAEILNETISQWATWKENSYYENSEELPYEVVVEAGYLDAVLYVLLHEASHVVDEVLNITPHFDADNNLISSTTNFVEGIWSEFNVPRDELLSPILKETRFRSGKIMSISATIDVYKALTDTPFVSLYSMASWFEDLAEAVTIYHLTVKMKQPYKIKVKHNNELHVVYEPLMNSRVKERLNQLKIFYY